MSDAMTEQDVATRNGNWLREGHVWLFGDHIDADIAIDFSPAISLATEPDVLRPRCMIGYDPEFPARAQPGDFILAGRNFGCGHVHPQFYFALRYFGLGAVLAESVNFRLLKQLVNYGVPILTTESARYLRAIVNSGDRLRIDLETGHAENLETGATANIEPLDAHLRGILERGGVFGPATEKIIGM